MRVRFALGIRYQWRPSNFLGGSGYPIREVKASLRTDCLAQRLDGRGPSRSTSQMQQEALAHTEDFGGPDQHKPGRLCRPGQDAPYAAYTLGAPYDEMFRPDGSVRHHYAALDGRLTTLPPDELIRRQQACELSFLHQGITFTVYSDNQATERIIPTDLLPRIVTAPEWARIEAGLKQRIQALNLFLRDIYGDGRVLKDGVIPRSMIYGSKHYRREMRGLPVPHGAYVNVCGSDLVRNEAGEFVVLEDNLRVPSGVSYMLANRDVVRRAFPAVFRSMGVRPIEQYPNELLSTLRSLAPFHEASAPVPPEMVS